MIRAVLDSSVLVSAFLKPEGLPATLLARAGEGAFALYLSPYILEETTRALLRPKLRASYRIAPEKVAAFGVELAAAARMVSDLPELQIILEDPKDDPILATAIAANADYLVAGDRKHMLKLGSYQNIKIITPRQFLDLL